MMVRCTLLCFFIAAFVLKDCKACPDDDDIVTLNAIAQGIMQLTDDMPPHNFSDPACIQYYNTKLDTLCTDFRENLTTIVTLLAECEELGVAATGLHMLSFLGRNFTELAFHFLSVDEFCDVCAPYLVSAWMVEEFINVDEGNFLDVFSQLEFAPAFCNESFVPGAIDDLVTGQYVCPPLWMEAGLPSALHINDTKQFTDEICESAIDGAGTQNLSDCIEAVEAQPAFHECMDNTADSTEPGTITSQFCDEECCGKRECVKQYFSSTCGILGMDLFIAATNLERDGSEYIISLYDCINGATVARMSVVAALGMTGIIFLL